MRPITRITLICLFVVLAAAAIYQAVIASRDRGPFPGPVPGTPFPSVSVAPAS